MIRHYTFLLIALPTFVTGSRVHAQSAAGNPCADAAGIVDVASDGAMLARMRQLLGTSPVSALTMRRPAGERATAECADVQAWHITLGRMQLQPLPARVRSTYNSRYPVDVNNGALWAGRGIGTAASGGFEVRAGPFSAAAYPVVALHENGAFPLSRPYSEQLSPFAYGGHVIDWPQRHGGEAFASLDAGQSYARVDAFGIGLGVSTENMWLGPAQRMPLLMGASAAGFPHLFLGTSQPLQTPLGSFEAQAFWGRLSESEWFDGPGDNDKRLLTGLSLVFEPAFARGLFLGGNRMFMATFPDWNFNSLIVDPYIDVRSNRLGDNQLLSLYARWVLPAAGFEVYGEWGREDHWGTWTDLLLEPDHSQAYMLGFQKTGSLRGAQLRWFGELAHLQSALPLRAGRGIVTFYTHTRVTQGYTHGGQLLGAWIGPGSDAQVLGVERVDDRRISGVMVERVRYDDDAYYTKWGRFYGHNGHDVSIGASLRHVEPVGEFTIGGSLGLAHRHNRQFVRLDGTHPGDFRAETNVQLELDLRWLPGR